MSRWIDKQVLRLDVSVADTQSVNVGKRSKHLVGIQFDEQLWNRLLHFDIVSHNSVHCLGNVIHDNIEVHFIRLVASRVKGMLHRDYVGMEQLFHYLKFSVLVALVLVDLLNSDALASLCNSCLVDDSKRSISNDSLSIIGQ